MKEKTPLEQYRRYRRLFTVLVTVILLAFALFFGAMMTDDWREQFDNDRPSVPYAETLAEGTYAYIEVDTFALFATLVPNGGDFQDGFHGGYYLAADSRTGALYFLNFPDSYEEGLLFEHDEETLILDEPVRLYGTMGEVTLAIEDLLNEHLTPEPTPIPGLPTLPTVRPYYGGLHISDSSAAAFDFFAERGLSTETLRPLSFEGTLSPERVTDPINIVINQIASVGLVCAVLLFIPLLVLAVKMDKYRPQIELESVSFRIRRARRHLWTAVVTGVLGFGTLFGGYLLPKIAWYWLTMLLIAASLICLIFYFGYYRFLLRSIRVLKRCGLLSVMDTLDHNLTDDPYNNILCGEQGFYATAPYVLIAYETVAWIEQADAEHVAFHLKTGERFLLRLQAATLFRLVNDFIKAKNPDLMVGSPPNAKSEYYHRNPKAKRSRKLVKRWWGLGLLVFAVTALIVGLVNQTLDLGNGTMVVAFAAGGLILVATSFSFGNLRERWDALWMSPVTSRVCKIATVTDVVGVMMLLIGGSARIYPLMIVGIALFAVSVVPFYFSIIKGVGFFGTTPPVVLLPTEPLLEASPLVAGVYGAPLGKGMLGYRCSLVVPLNRTAMERQREHLVTCDINSATTKYQEEQNRLIVYGTSRSLGRFVRVEWYPMEGVIAVYFPYGDTDLARRYVETLLRCHFGTADALKAVPSENIVSEWDKAMDARKSEEAAEVYLDDVTFIREMRQTTVGAWHQYDILFAARGYGWETMKEWADYLAGADLTHVAQVMTASLGIEERDVTASYHEHGSCAAMPELVTECGTLSIAGFSTALHAPVKIVWINQTRTLRLFANTEDETLVRKYVETAARRTFGTADAMKLGKPLPENA